MRPGSAAISVWLGDFLRAAAEFFMDAAPQRVNHHGQEEDFLILPCDWRFLPKLGPLRSLARGPFSPLACEAHLVTCLDTPLLGN
jgi:hypothetical protein